MRELLMNDGDLGMYVTDRRYRRVEMPTLSKADSNSNTKYS
jgi:hypothetical protein